MKPIVSRLAMLLTLAIVIGLGAFYLRPLFFFDELIRYHLWSLHARSLYTQVDGHRIHYYEARPPHGRAGVPLLLIHGLGARSEDWSGLIPTLAARGFHVYALDLLGFGRSDKPEGFSYSIADQEQLVVDFMRTVGVSRADVAGWSMGGWIALKLTEDHPEQVDRLVLYDAVGIYFPATYGAELFTPTDAAGVWKLQGMLTPDPKPLPGFIDRDALRKLAQAAPVIRASVASMLTGRDLTDKGLRGITQPTLIVWGEQDRLVPLSVGQTMHAAIPDSELLVLQGCGHLAPAECTRPVLKGTIAFLTAKAKPPVGEMTVPGRAK